MGGAEGKKVSFSSLFSKRRQPELSVRGGGRRRPTYFHYRRRRRRSGEGGGKKRIIRFERGGKNSTSRPPQFRQRGTLFRERSGRLISEWDFLGDYFFFRNCAEEWAKVFPDCPAP